MGEFKFNNITFNEIGKIKLGTENVQKIYNGFTQVFPAPEPIGENEVLIGNLVWTKPNVSETEPGILIATTDAEAISYLNNDQAACVYFNFDSSNNSRGLLFNRQGALSLTPPDGFRLPTFRDWSKLSQVLERISGSQDITNVTGGTPNFLPPDITSKPEFGTSGFDSQGRGWARRSGDNIAFNQSGSEFYWEGENVNPDQAESTPGFSYEAANSIIKFAYQSNTNKYAYVRFVRDY